MPECVCVIRNMFHHTHIIIAIFAKCDMPCKYESENKGIKDGKSV